MNDKMSPEEHKKEIDFWLQYNEIAGNFKHKQFYEFFPLSEVCGDVLEIGCGGCPFDSYVNVRNHTTRIALVDPILEELSKYPKYHNLKKYKKYSCQYSEFKTSKKFDHIVCLNVLDHFQDDHIAFLEKISSEIMRDGLLYLYYDYRQENSDGHCAVDTHLITQYLNNHYHALKESLSINPKHRGWAKTKWSYRGVLKKI